MAEKSSSRPAGQLPSTPPLFSGSESGQAAAFKVSGISKRYGSTQALGDLTLQVPRGSVYALVGPNGSGKTTLFKIMSGLISPDSGSVEVLGIAVRHGNPPPVAMAMVPQGYALYDYMSVRDHVAFAARFYPQRWDGDFVERSLANLEFNQKAAVGNLSQGQKAQLALILALGQRPEAIILDEPTASLDPVMRREFHRLVIGEAAARGQTILLSSHNLTEVERVADRVGFLRKGKLVAERVVDEIRHTDREVRVVFQAEPPVDLGSLPGVQSLEQKGTTYRLRIVGDLEPVVVALQQYHPFALEVVEQSLEDLFFALNPVGGGKEE